MPAKKTIRDVALLAGVSPATVSRVLNDNPRVSAENRERVLGAAKALRFRPNTQARLLAGKRTSTLLLIHPIAGPLTWYFHLLEAGLLKGCGRNGFQLDTLMVFPDSPRRMAKILQPIERGTCEGVVLAAPFSDDPEIIAAVRASRMPFVIIAAGAETRALAAGVGMDDEAAGHMMARHLLGLGHRRFGFTLGLPDHLSAQERFVGARKAFAEAGLGEDAVVEAEGGLDFPSGFAAFNRIHATGFKPTAVICANDESAAGAIHAARMHGLQLPGALNIVGFDDAPFTRLLSPPLTTIAQTIDIMGTRAVTILADAIRKIERPYEMVKPRLVIRESSERVRDFAASAE